MDLVQLLDVPLICNDGINKGKVFKYHSSQSNGTIHLTNSVLNPLVSNDYRGTIKTFCYPEQSEHQL